MSEQTYEVTDVKMEEGKIFVTLKYINVEGKTPKGIIKLIKKE